MAQENQPLVSVQCHLKQRDYDDVFRIYLEIERTWEKKVTTVISGGLVVACLVLFFVFHNYSFLFYALVCVGIGFAYWFIPANKKFIATSRLLMGENQEISFYPYHLSSREIYDNLQENVDEENAEELSSEDEGIVVKTTRMAAYENERGFLFADGKISNVFVYVPKRDLSESQLTAVQDFAKTRCSSGYQLLEMHSLLEDEPVDVEAEPEDSAESEDLTDSVCDYYFGARKLRLHDADGRPIFNEDELEDAASPVDEEGALDE